MMQRQSVRHHSHNDKTQESPQSQLSAQTQYLQNVNQQFQGKQCQSNRSASHQSNKVQMKQTDHINSLPLASTEHQNNLQVLQSKLCVEAEKILKWKVSTDLEISQKEKKLLDTEVIVERQRKNLFELQMHSEQLSQRLQVELKNREKLSSKIENTRNICNIIRDHCNKLTTTLNVCVDEKENLKSMYSQQHKDIEAVQEKYEKMDANFRTEMEQLEELVREERNQRNKIIVEANAMHAILNEKIDALEKNNVAEREKSKGLNQQLQQNFERMKMLETENEGNAISLSLLKSQVAGLESQLAVQKSNFELEMKETVAKMEQERLRCIVLQNQCVEAQENLREIMATQEKIISENSMLKENLEKLEFTNQKLNEDLQRATVERTMVLKERDTLVSKLQDLEEINVNFQALKVEYDSILQEKQSTMDELKNVQDKLIHFENAIREMKDTLKMYADENSKLMIENNCFKESVNSLTDKLRDAELLELEKKNSIEFLERELDDIRSQLTSLESKYSLDTSELTAHVDEIQAECVRKDEVMKSLGMEMEKSNLHVHRLQEQENMHLVQIRNLEEENENIKKSTECDSEKIDTLNDKIKMESGKNEELSKDLEEIKSQANKSAQIIESCVLEKQELEQKIVQLQDTLEKVSKERIDFEQKFMDISNERDTIQLKSDSEIKEMVAVLEKYKRECDGIVNQKEANITKLSSNLEEIHKVKEDLEEQVIKLQKDNNSSLRKLTDLEKEKDIVEKTLQVKVMDLELKLTAKEKEMAEKEVALLKSGANKSPYSERVFSTPSKIHSSGMGDKTVIHTPKSGVSPAPIQLTCTPHQNPSILKEPNTPGGTKKQVTFQEDTSDTDASSVDAMILDNSDLISRFEALERGVKMMTPMRVFPSPKNRRKMVQKKVELQLKNEENDPEFKIKKARIMRNKQMNENIHLKGNKYLEGSGLNMLLKPTKHSDLEEERNTGLDLDELFEMVED